MKSTYVVVLGIVWGGCGAATPEEAQVAPVSTSTPTDPPTTETPTPARRFAEQVVLAHGAAEQSRGTPTEAGVIEAAEVLIGAAMRASEIATEARVASVPESAADAAQRIRTLLAALRSHLDSPERIAFRMELEQALEIQASQLSSAMSAFAEATSVSTWAALCIISRVDIFKNAATRSADAAVDGADASRLSGLIALRDAARDLDADLSALPLPVVDDSESALAWDPLDSVRAAQDACARAAE